jgi:hypothetical protein
MIEEATLQVESLARMVTPRSEAERRLAAALNRCLSELHETVARSARQQRQPRMRAPLRLV